MGFDSENQSGSGRPAKYLKIYSEKDASKAVTGKFFSITEKVDGQYVTSIMKNPSGYPLPFFGYLKDIKVDLDNVITKKATGEEIKAPNIKFTFNDDQGDKFILDLPFSNDKGNVSSNVSTILNSLAGITKFGYIKLYINSSVDKKGVKQFNVNLKNHTNWANSGKDLNDFLTPKDGGLDLTRVSWKYKFDELPKIEVEKVVDGETVKINNVKKHQEFFLTMINDMILPTLKESGNYDTYTTPRATTTISSTYSSVDEDDDSEVATATKPSTIKTSSSSAISSDTDDLPF